MSTVQFAAHYEFTILMRCILQKMCISFFFSFFWFCLSFYLLCFSRCLFLFFFFATTNHRLLADTKNAHTSRGTMWLCIGQRSAQIIRTRNGCIRICIELYLLVSIHFDSLHFTRSTARERERQRWRESEQE